MKLTLENIKWLTIAGLILYIILLQQCSGGSSDCQDATVTTKTVTSLIKGDTDTIEIPVDRPIYITVGIPTPTVVTVTSDSGDIAVNQYVTEINDSLIEGTITSKVDGTLIAQHLDYIPLFPKYITRVDTLVVDRTTTVVKKKNYLGIGAEIGGSSSSFNVSPIVSLTTKKGYIYNYRYGLLDKTHNIGIVRRLSFSK